MKSVVAAGITGFALGLLLQRLRPATPTSSAEDPSPSSTPPRILLLVNGPKETAALVAAFEASPSTTFHKSNAAVSFGQLFETSNNAIHIFTTNSFVGEETVVTSLVALLSENKYDLVIVVGCCGALAPLPTSSTSSTSSTSATSSTSSTSFSPNIGDIVASYPTTSFFERRIAEFGPVSKRQGIGETPTWEYTHLVAKRTQQNLEDASMTTKIVAGKMASGRSFATDETGFRWMETLQVVAKDMEAAAAVSTCRQFGVPATALKVVVTLVHDAKNDVKHEFDRYRESCIPVLTQTAKTFVHCALAQLDYSKRQLSMFHDTTSLSTSSMGGVVAIHVAMNEEARPIATALQLVPTVLAPFAKHGMMCWIGTAVVSGSSNTRISIVMVSHGTDHQLGMSRVSTQIATLCCNIICRTYGTRLRCMINAGTAGAMSGKGLNIGSVVVAAQVGFIDARGVDSLTKVYRSLHVWKEMSDKILQTLNQEGKPALMTKAMVGTGSSFDLSPTDLLSLHQLKADVKEMEAASVVWTCNQWSVPVVVLKSITDFVEHEEGAEEFSMNLYGKALQSLCAVMPSVVRVVVEEFR